MNKTITFALWLSALLCGCSSSGTSTPEGAGGASGQAGAGTDEAGGNQGGADARTLMGTITLSLKRANEATGAKAFSVAGGTIYDGPMPNALPLKLALEEAGCQLLKPKVPFCNEGCGGDAVCVDDDTCLAYPKAQDVGLLQLRGVGAEPISLEPFAPSFAYQSAALPHPPCTEGDAVDLQADGFAASTSCIAPLVLSSTDFVVKRDQAVSLRWEAPREEGATRVLIKLDVSHHGGKKGEIDCDVADTGQFEIPESLVTALVDLGLAGFPTIVLTRVSSAASSEEPAIKLEMSSGIELAVDTGIVSCTDDTECPTEQLCNMDKLVCE
jgi:hypothetical protein